jgi:Aspartyl/Asparaginyl beta-hydroxylase
MRIGAPLAMLELPGQAFLDKASLIGACVRLPLQFDVARLAAEVEPLPPTVWCTTGGRVGVHQEAQAIFLRGHAPAEGDLPIEDRPALATLPYISDIVQRQILAPPMRCLLARLPAGGRIPTHIDRAPYFAQTVRLHIPIISHERAYMFCAGQRYVMRPGEVWALNNNAPHAVWNADQFRERIHLICDFLPTAQLYGLLAAGERNLGNLNPEGEPQSLQPGLLQPIH